MTNKVIKNNYHEYLLKLSMMILIVFLAMLVSTKVVKANASGKIGNVGTLISNANELTAINMSLTNTMSVSNNIYNLGITDKAATGAKGKGYGSRGNLSVNTNYTITYTNAITIDNQKYTLTVTLRPTQKGSGGYISLWISTSNVITVYPYRSKVQVTYTITNSSGNTVDKYLVYGFGDPDGGNYLFDPTSADIYYKNPGSNSDTFKNDFEVKTTGTKGIISSEGNDHDYADAWIYIAPNNGTSTFTMTLDASMTTSGGDALNLPSLYSSPRLLIFYHMNGGSLQSAHGTTIGTSGNYVTLNGSKSIHKFKTGETMGTSGLANYNNSNYINVARTGYHVTSGQEFNTKANGSGTSFNQGDNTNYSFSTFSPYKSSDGIVTLYIKWVANTYTIGYTLNGGTHGSSHPTSATYDSVVNISNPTRAGYTFAGWTMTGGNTSTAKYGTSSSSVNTAWSNASTKVTAQYFKNLTSTNNGTVTLVANWTPITYTIGYTLNGGSVSPANPTTYTVETTTFTLRNPTRTGYTFAGWTGSNGTTPQTTVSIAKGSTGNKTYTANWTPITYTIGYTLNGGSVSPANPTSYTIETTTFTLRNPTRTGYTFSGWTGSNGTTPQTTVSIAKGSTGNKTYTANWTPITYTIGYTLNGGSVSPANPTTYTIETATFTLNNPIKTGYTFAGWTGSNGTTAQTSVSIANGSTGNKTYTANWTPIQYTITYNLDGGTVATANPTTYTIETNTFTLNNPIKTGYTFTGWTGSNGTTAQTTVSIAKGSTGNKSYTANWTANTATITIKKDNSNWTTNNTVLVELRSSTNTYNGTKSGATVTWTAIPSGTYNIYASKNDTNPTNINTLIDTGIDLVITSSGTGTIDYYTLQLQPGIGISAVSGDGTYLKNQQANIDATVATGYTWQGWSVISGNSPD